MSRKKTQVGDTMRLLELNDEAKIKCAVRAISGEPLNALALEYGVSEQVIQGWVDLVGDLVEETADSSTQEDLEKKIAAKRAECYRLQQQIEAQKKQIERRETELRMLNECPPFMIGGGRR